MHTPTFLARSSPFPPNSSHPERSRRRCLGARIVLTIFAVMLPGCAGYNLYPANPEEPLAFTDPNSPPMRPATQAALRYVIERWPARDDRFNTVPFTVNLPVGTRRVACEEVTRALGPDARLLTPDSASLPTFHVRSIWIRGDEGKVEILRPVGDLDPGTDSSGAVYQGITAHVRGGWSGWRVIAHNTHVVGAVRPPDLYFAPDYPESAAQAAARSARERRAAQDAAAADTDATMGSAQEQLPESFDESTDGSGREAGDDSGVMRPADAPRQSPPPATPAPAPAPVQPAPEPLPEPDDGGEHVLPLKGGGGGGSGGG